VNINSVDARSLASRGGASFNLLGGSGGSATWHRRTPRIGGRIDGVVSHGTSANNLIIGSPGGGIWRTTDNGSTWTQPASYGMGDFTILHLEWDRIDSSRLLAVTPMTVYASTDNGDNWSNIGGYSTPPYLWHKDSRYAALGNDPVGFAQLKFSSTARTLLWARPCDGLLYSTNGTSFSHLWPFSNSSSNIDNCILAVAADDDEGRVYFATARTETNSPPRIYRSNCQWTSTGPCCTTPDTCWTLIDSGLPNQSTVMGLTWTGYPDDFSAQLYLNTGTSRVYNTYDGSSWSATTAFSSTQWAPRHVVHAGGMSNQLFANNLLPEQTTNLGSSWSDFWTSNLHADTRAVYLDSSRGYLWAATDGAGNNGAEYNLARWSWSINNAPTSPTNVPVTGNSGLPIWQPYYVVETPSGTSSVRLFMGSQDNNGLCSDDRGVNWTTSGASMFFGDEISMVISGNRAYAWGNSNTLRRSDDAGNLSASCSDVAWTSTTSTGLGAPPSV